MAPRAEKRLPRAPKLRHAGDGQFFPNEVVRILHLQRIDYRQLRELLVLVRSSDGRTLEQGKWARYSFRDLVALRVAIDLVGGRAALGRGRIAGLKALRSACKVLREQYGMSSPLTQATLRRDGKQIIADVGGVMFVPQSGQVLFAGLERAVTAHVRKVGASADVQSIAQRLRRERHQLKAHQSRQLRKCRVEDLRIPIPTTATADRRRK